MKNYFFQLDHNNSTFEYQLSEQIKPILEKSYGLYCIIQGEYLDFLGKNIKIPFKYHILEKDLSEPLLTSVISHNHQMAFLENSIDLFISSFYLENQTHKTSVLSEAYRVLRPGGTAIFLGCNNNRLALAQLVRAIRKMNFEIKYQQTFLFYLPQNQSSYFETKLRKWLPWLGSHYLLVASKQSLGANIIPLKWKAFSSWEKKALPN